MVFLYNNISIYVKTYNVLNKNSNICKIDNVIISSDSERAIHKLSTYLRKKHNMTLREYVLKYYYNNINPVCECGCGEKTKFHKGKFFKYVGNHKNKIKPTNDILLKQKKNRALKNTLNLRLKRLGYSADDLINIYNEFINFKINFTDIEKKYAIDKRTIRKYWYELKLIENKELFNRICKKHQNYWSSIKVDRKIKIDDDILLNVYKFLRKHPNRHTLKEIKNMYNLNQSSLVLYKRLVDVFDKEEIDKHLKLGISSKPEIEFFNILRFYYGEDIQKNFVLNRKQYDYILLNKILIEYDGDYWHSMPNKIMVDKEKDILAKKNGYIIIRVKDSESKNVEVLHKINKIYLKVKKNEINV